MRSIIPTETIERRILFLRGRRVILDRDIAEIYCVSTKRLNEQVKRNRNRFPEDFMFQLTAEEAVSLRSQIVTSSVKASAMRSQFATASKRNIRHLPYVFTEHGAIMLASVLNSPVAIEASIRVVRAFVRFRSILAAHKELAAKVADMEKKYDGQFQIVFTAIKKLMGSAAASSETSDGIFGRR